MRVCGCLRSTQIEPLHFSSLSEAPMQVLLAMLLVKLAHEPGQESDCQCSVLQTKSVYVPLTEPISWRG